jgi:MOSC domain-containing protein YiiM
LKSELIGVGKVASLCIDGTIVDQIEYGLDGAVGDKHRGFTRALGGHDGAYARTSKLRKGAPVLNWRTWTALSLEELAETEKALGVEIPAGCLLENMIISGIPNFSKLAPTTRLVFPERPHRDQNTQAMLAVWEENTPCAVVGARLARHHNQPGLTQRFVVEARNRRGVVGLVLAAGLVENGDVVSVYSPAR